MTDHAAKLRRRKVWLDGKLVPFSRATVHLMSHSFGRGSAVFEVMSVHDTIRGPAVFRLDDHLRRLRQSAELIRMKPPLSFSALKAAVKETVIANRVRRGMVKLVCFYGGVELEVIPRNPRVSTAVFALDLFRDLGGGEYKTAGRPATATIAAVRKPSPLSMPVQSKAAANYLPGMIAKLDAIKAGFDMPIMLDLQGNVAEGPTESIFIVKNGVLKTPALGNILDGITRRTIIQVARDYNIKVVEKKMKPAELYAADEVFFASSIVKTWPVSRIDDREFSAPGQITRLLDEILGRILTGKIKPYDKWLFPVE